MVLWRHTGSSIINTPKNVIFIIENWNAKVGNQEIPGVRGKFGLGVQNEAGQRLTEFCQENALVIANSKHQSCLIILEIIMNFQISSMFHYYYLSISSAWNWGFDIEYLVRLPHLYFIVSESERKCCDFQVLIP